MILPLTKLEAFELLEHMRARQDLWHYSHDLWLRTNGDADVLLAVRISNGLPDDMYAMHVRALKDPDASAYALWMRDKFTSYPERAQLEELLTEHCKEGVDVAQLAARIQNLQNMPLPDVLDVGEGEPSELPRVQLVDKKTGVTIRPVTEWTPASQPVVPKSRYLRNLIKQGNAK